MSNLLLTDVIAIWDVLHVHDTGDIGYCDLEAAIEEAGIQIINNAPQQPDTLT